MGDPGGIRNLDQLQEADDETRLPRTVTAAFVVLGAACVVFAGMALVGRTSRMPAAKTDPLGDLVSQRPRGASSAAVRATDLSPKDVTFPQLLSDDDDKPSTALAAVRAPGSSYLVAPTIPTQPPPPTDRLPVVPIPAQAVLEATPVVTHPRDALTKVATDAAQLAAPPSGDEAPAGHEGGYQLQVSSFHTQSEAQAFADQLRARGHKAYVLEAHVPGRGTWFRVRVGPFPTQHAATQYRASFEAREHVVPFVVPPETTAKAH
ncbi:MAG TPA: SPOR domain-containing protein [Polyangiaceae bacterium]|nr:SPOR domain-containing protein [Polyangiaceae bacterium]